MKSLVTVLIFFFSGLSSFSQTILDTDGLNNPDNVFLFVLKEYCKTLDSVATDVVYVRKQYPIGDSWPKKIEGFQIEYLSNDREYKEAIKKNSGGITVVGLGDLELRDGDFYVGVIPFGASYKKRTIHLVNGGSWLFYFDYDPEKKGLIYRSKERHGI